MVPDVYGVLHGERPKADVGVVRPMQSGVDEHGAEPLGDSADGSFGHPILVVGTDAGEGLLLMLLSDIGEPFVAREDSVVPMVFPDGDPHGRGGLLEDGLALDAFPGAKGYLRAEEDITAGVIDANESTGESFGIVLAASGVWKASFGAADEVVDGDAVARPEVVLTDSHLLRGDCSREVGFVPAGSRQPA